MTRELQLKIRCGEKTCAEEPGVFCQFLRTRIDGSRPRCSLFGDEPLFDSIMGWLLRCQECLDAEGDVRGLIKKWRQVAKCARPTISDAITHCADQLEEVIGK